MEEIKLDVQLRNQVGRRKVKKVYDEGFVPAVVYGGKTKGSTVVKVNRRAYEHITRLYHGQSLIFHLSEMDGNKKLKDYPAIVKEEQHEPVSDELVHIDFHRISLTEEIEVKVRIVTKGEAVGVKKDGGSLDHAIWELSVVCLPTKIPDKIEVNVSDLKIGDAIHVKDVVLPEGVRTKHDPEAILVSVVPPMKEIELPPEGVEESIEPEVIKEKKEKEEEAVPEEKEKVKEKSEEKEKKAEG